MQPAVTIGDLLVLPAYWRPGRELGESHSVRRWHESILRRIGTESDSLVMATRNFAQRYDYIESVLEHLRGVRIQDGIQLSSGVPLMFRAFNGEKEIHTLS